MSPASKAAEELAQAAGALRLCRELRRQPARDECKAAAGNRERADPQSILDEAHRELYKPRKILLMLGQVAFRADVV